MLGNRLLALAVAGGMTLGWGALCGAAGTAPVRLADAARPAPEIPGAPKESDVCMRSLRPRPMNNKDPHDTLEAIKGFHVTWLEWTYGDDADFIRKVHELGATYGGAMAAGSYSGDEPRETWNVRDREGNLVFATWMRKWPRPNPWGCANHPEFREGHVRAAAKAIEAGADLLQRDEPGQGKHALRWGGCFCEHCMKGFNRWLEKNGDPELLRGLGVADLAAFDYRDYLREKNSPVGDAFHGWPGDRIKVYFNRFQVESTVEFNKWWREELNRRVGRRVPVSCNNGVKHWTEIEQVFDYCIGELSAGDARPEILYAAMRKARSHGKTQSVTMPLHRHDNVTPEWIRLIRQTIATVYAVGGHIEMPWDTYLPTPDAKRFFGEPADYADLTAFVRAMAPRLDGYADAFATGERIEDPRWGDAPPVTLSDGADGVYAFARAIPGKTGAPVAIHLLDWKAEPRPFRLSLRPAAFFGERPLTFRLFAPVLPYDKAAHDRAFETKDYSRLLRETALPGGTVTSVDIPALAPWGILVVEPGDAATAALWPPSFLSNDARFYDEAQVLLECATPGATIRYTLDGSDPTARSPLYEGPAALSDSATVKARSFLGTKASEVVVARFEKRDPPVNLIVNGEFDDGIEGWTRVVFDLPQVDADALDLDLDATGRISGPNSARLFVRNPTGVVYHLRMTQPFRAEADTLYELTFTAVADGPVECRVGLQGAGPPHRVTGMRTQMIDETVQNYRLTGFNAEEAYDCLVQFDLGALTNKGRTVWIDAVRLEPMNQQQRR